MLHELLGNDPLGDHPAEDLPYRLAASLDISHDLAALQESHPGQSDRAARPAIEPPLGSLNDGHHTAPPR